MTASIRPHAVVTICALNYLGRAIVLVDSLWSMQVDCDAFIVVVDRKDHRIEAKHPGVRIIWAEDLGIPGFLSAAMKFDVVELSTNVKPSALRRLLARYEKVFYIDPDIRLYAPLTPAITALESHAIVVTPHALSPILDGRTPSDETFSRMGSFNLGFIGVRACEESFSFLEWWSERCLKLGFYEPQSGLAVDQKWMDLAPCYFPSLGILRDPGFNVAFWNLHERVLSFRDGQWWVNGDWPLRFFHFSSFAEDDPHAIAHKQSRYASGDRPDVHPLLDDYSAMLVAAGHLGYAERPYGFDYFGDGSYVTPMLRRVFASLEDRFPPEEDPFAVGSAVQRFAMDKRLALRNRGPARRVIFKDMDRYSGASRLINRGLRIILRIVGPERYFLLMKYLVRVSSIRTQTDLVSKDP